MDSDSRRYDAISTGEPDELKGSRPVRWGAVGKVPGAIAASGNSLAAYPVDVPARPPLVAAETGADLARGTAVCRQCVGKETFHRA
jgi:hypothetical protein